VYVFVCSGFVRCGRAGVCDSGGNDYEECSLMVCDAVYSTKYLPTFQTKVGNYVPDYTTSHPRG
jgi:hypothetical protein